jgi:hypothetical protein
VARKHWAHLVAAVVALGLSAAPAPTAGAADIPWIEGDPLLLWFDSSPPDMLHAAFKDHSPDGVLSMDNGFELALYTGSTSYELWGFLDRSHIEGDDRFSYRYGTDPTRTGSGSASDPYVYRQKMYGGQQSQLEITESIVYVNGAARFRVRWDVRNVGSSAVNFRATHAADVDAPPGCALGRFRAGPPRSVGAYGPEEGVHTDGNTCTDPYDRQRGAGSYLEEVSSSPWSRYEEGDLAGISDPNGPGLDNTYSAAPMDAWVGAQWDGYGRGKTGLAPGQTATFEVDWRMTNELLATPWKTIVGENCPYTLTLSTRYAEGGPHPGRLIQWETVDGNYRRSGSVRTDSSGVARLSWTRDFGFDQTSVFLDRNEDGVLQDANELARQNIDTQWSPAGACPPGSGPSGPTGPTGPAARVRPALNLRHAFRHRRWVVARGSLAGAATGTVQVTVRARRHGRVLRSRRTVSVRAGHFSAWVHLGRSLRRANRATVIARYSGDAHYLAAAKSRGVRLH